MTIAHCRSEQLRCAGEFHDAGARLGLHDWFAEEFLMEQENRLPKPYYEHAGITIYHGDCREILPGLPKVDLVLTDPPYGTQDLGGGYGRRQLHSTDGRNGRVIQNDRDLSIVEAVAPLLWNRLTEDAWVVVFAGARRMLDVGQIMRGVGFEYFGCCVWDKGAPGLGYTIRYSHEDAMVFKKGSPAKPEQPVISTIRAHVEPTDHPHEKPLHLLKMLLRLSKTGQVLLDPFCGIGSTLASAKESGISAIGIEIEEKYCEMAAKRLAQEVLW